jgi:hypothetical protein
MNEIPHLPSIQLSKEQIIWMDEVWKLLKKDGNNPSYKKIRLNTRDKTGDQFDPTTIDQTLLKEKCTQITLLGVLHIDSHSDILEDADKIVVAIRKRVVDDAGQEEFSIAEIASDLELDKKYVQIVFSLVSMYGNFWNSASSQIAVNTPYGYEHFSIKNEDTFDFYIKFKNIHTTIDNYYIKQGEYKKREQGHFEVLQPPSFGNKLLGYSGLEAAKNHELFDRKIFADARGYIKKIADQASRCYQYELYDASLVLIRKLVESLIIEAFERYDIGSKIKDTDGHYFLLSQLIGCLTTEKRWSLGRNTINGLPKLKRLGDASAHNRRFLAQKSDIDKVADELRMIIDEIIHLIDYPTWNREKQEE